MKIHEDATQFGSRKKMLTTFDDELKEGIMRFIFQRAAC